MKREGLDLVCRQMGVGKVTWDFTRGRGCHGCLLITPEGTVWMEGNIGANTQIRQSKQGLAIISGRPSKPVTHQGSGVPETSRLQLVPRSSCLLCTHPPLVTRWTLRGWPGSLKSGCRHEVEGGLVRNREPRPEWKVLQGIKN